MFLDDEIEVLRPDLPRGRFRSVLFDFDGTLSLIREGWPQIMIPMMVEELRRTGTAEAILAQAPDFTDAWVEVILSLDKANPDLVARIRALPEVIKVLFAEPQEATTTNSERDRRSHADRPAGELFREYYKSRKNVDPEPQLMALFERLYQEAATASETGD
jgi:phosphoglycolate phosphatase-like HAD superfamily hydrolase